MDKKITEYLENLENIFLICYGEIAKLEHNLYLEYGCSLFFKKEKIIYVLKNKTQYDILIYSPYDRRIVTILNKFAYKVSNYTNNSIQYSFDFKDQKGIYSFFNTILEEARKGIWR